RCRWGGCASSTWAPSTCPPSPWATSCCGVRPNRCVACCGSCSTAEAGRQYNPSEEGIPGCRGCPLLFRLYLDSRNSPMPNNRNIALVGLTGLAGEALLSLLDEHEFDFEQIHLVDTEEQAGGRHMVKGHSQRVEVLERFDFSQVAVVLFADAWLASDWADRVVAA